MGKTLGERLAEARRAAFVGRGEELAFFASWIREPEPDVSVLFVHGPAGVGKSTLLRRFADLYVGIFENIRPAMPANEDCLGFHGCFL